MNLSLKGNKVYKGDSTHNGMLLKVHENAFTTGYSDLLSPDGKNKGETRFGNGVFYDLARKDNALFTGSPTYQGAFPYFAGILCRQQDIASSYPVYANKNTSFNKGLLVKEGYLNYRVALYQDADKKDLTVSAHLNSYVGYFFRVNLVDGYIGFSMTNLSDATWQVVGRVVQCNPDDESVTVHISPQYWKELVAEPAANPTITAPVSDKNSITIKAEATKGFALYYTYKKTAEAKFTKNCEGIKAHFDSASGKFVCTIKIQNLEKNTEYKIFVVGRGITGYKVDTLTKSTTN